MIKAIVFDIDGVLIDSFEANLKFYQTLMPRVGYKAPTRKEYQSLFHYHLWGVIEALTKAPTKEIQRIWDIGSSREVPYPDELIKTTPGLYETVDKLAKKYKLGVVTNRVKMGIEESPVLQKLAKHFHTVITYEDTKNHKPHPEPLLLACKRLEVEPSESVYVGDVENDIKTGKAAGTKTLLFANKIADNPDAFTSGFTDIPNIIRTLERTGS